MVEKKPARDRKLPACLRHVAEAAVGPAPANEDHRRARHATGSGGQEVSAGYEVGYGRPPVHSRFRLGQSGNPKGRRRGARDLKIILEEALTARIPVSSGGRKKMMRLIDAAAAQLTRKGASGDTSALRLLFDLAARYGALMEKEESLDRADELNAEDRRILEDLKNRLAYPADAEDFREGHEEEPEADGEETSV